MARLDMWNEIEPEIGYLALIGPCRGLAVDVGANYGLYSYALSKLYRHVVAFEPNPKALTPLAAWDSPLVTLEHFALSSAPGRSTLYVPVTKGIEMKGWASLDPDNCPHAERVAGVEIELRTLDSFGLTDVGFIKIDTEGHELDVLAGAEATIKASRPHLLVEIRRLNEVRTLLESWGYHGCTLKDLAGVPGSPANFIFRPSQRDGLNRN